MNYTKASCGHPVVAIGHSESHARKKCESEPCDECKQQVRRMLTVADMFVLNELHEMLDCIDTDLRVHDIDTLAPQSTLGQTLLDLMKAYHEATTDVGGSCARCGRHRNGL